MKYNLNDLKRFLEIQKINIDIPELKLTPLRDKLFVSLLLKENENYDKFTFDVSFDNNYLKNILLTMKELSEQKNLDLCNEFKYFNIMKKLGVYYNAKN